VFQASLKGVEFNLLYIFLWDKFYLYCSYYSGIVSTFYYDKI